MRLDEILDKEIFTDTLKGEGEYQVTSTGSKFTASVVIPYTSEQAPLILKRQKEKFERFATLTDTTWKVIYARQFEQRVGWSRRTRSVWTYVVVGKDATGNEIAYYKYESNSDQAGQSWIFVNKHKDKEKLSWFIGTEPGDPKPNKVQAMKKIKQMVANANAYSDEKKALQEPAAVKPEQIYRKVESILDELALKARTLRKVSAQPRGSKTVITFERKPSSFRKNDTGEVRFEVSPANGLNLKVLFVTKQDRAVYNRDYAGSLREWRFTAIHPKQKVTVRKLKDALLNVMREYKI